MLHDSPQTGPLSSKPATRKVGLIAITIIVVVVVVVGVNQSAQPANKSITNWVLSNSDYVCPAGTFKNPQGSTVCDVCPVGKKCPAGNSGAVDCGAGTFQDVTGQDVCKQCATDTFQPSTGQTSCVACPTGTTSPAGSPTCTCSAASGSSVPQASKELIGSYANIKSKIETHGCSNIALAQKLDVGQVYWNTQGCEISGAEVLMRVGTSNMVFTVTVKNDNSMTCAWRFWNYATSSISHHYNGYTMEPVCAVDKLVLIVKPVLENKPHAIGTVSTDVLVGTNKICPGYVVKSVDGATQISFPNNRNCFKGIGSATSPGFIGNGQQTMTDGSMLWLQFHGPATEPTYYCHMTLNKVGQPAVSASATLNQVWDLSPLGISGSFKCLKAHFEFVY